MSLTTLKKNELPWHLNPLNLPPIPEPSAGGGCSGEGGGQRGGGLIKTWRH